MVPLFVTPDFEKTLFGTESAIDEGRISCENSP